GSVPREPPSAQGFPPLSLRSPGLARRSLRILLCGRTCLLGYCILTGSPSSYRADCPSLSTLRAAGWPCFPETILHPSSSIQEQRQSCYSRSRTESFAL